MSRDYTSASIGHMALKVARYVRLFGLRRTLAKIKGQYHMKSTESFDNARWENAACQTPDDQERSVAIVGCGNYAYSNIAYYLRRHNPRFLRATFDRNKCRALSLCKDYGGFYAALDWRELLSDPQVRIVFIASNHASHAEYAIACIEAGKHVHIEKPHVVSEEQLDRLIAAMNRNREAKVFLGFNRPKSPLFRRLQRMSEEEVGPFMINWFIAGHEIPEDHWYFDDKEGGRVLGNLCHWTDLTLRLVSMERAFPCRIIPGTPARGRSDFIVSVNFADQSCASITFSAKGHTFEGVREVLNVHKGNLLANLTDFQFLTVDVVERKRAIRLRHRDHGHGANILHSVFGASQPAVPGEDLAYVAATARFFLAIRHALDTGETVIVEQDDATGAQG